ncbi:MAG: hypothetical protein JNN17_11670 [Verrucomicrobiaceae bacterium]|nr:hypothetical protein [Verrucomicrobiaceae bacterium]
MKTTLLSLSLAVLTTAASAKVERVWMTHQSPDNSRIVISWETTTLGDSVVEFGTSPQLGESVKVDGSRTLHQVEIPIPQKDVVYHYRVKSGDQVSEINTFKGYPSKLLRIAVVANIRADAKLSFAAIKKDDPHLLISAGDTAMQYQFATQADKEATKSHSTAIDTQADLFKSTPLMVSLGNLDRKIRPNGLSMEEPGYDVEATGYRKFFALPGKEWIWAWDVPDFDLRLISVDMSHTGDFGKPNQACHAFDKDSEQFKWFEETMNATKTGFVVTLFGETGGTVRRHAEGGWKRVIGQGTLAISGECYHAERTEVDGVTYYNSSVRGNGTFGHDPQAAFSDKAASYQLLTLDRGAGTLRSELKALDDGRVLDSKTFTKRAK